MSQVLEEIRAEREYQDEQWGLPAFGELK